MKHKKRITAAIMAAVMSCSAMTAVMPALTGTAITASAAASLSISSSQMSLGKGESVKLTANQSVTWRTSAPKILTVDKNGNVKAVGTGTAWITARSKSGSEKSCKITVKKAPTWVGISQSSLTMGVGETFTLSANVASDAGAATRTFRTSNSGIVKMTKTNWTGSFTAVKPGTAWVTVRLYNGLEKSCKITVKKAPTWVGLTTKNMTLTVGQTGTLGANIASDAGCATRTFRTSNSGIVKMTRTNWTGQFKAVKPGTAWVTVRTYNGKEASCKVTVLSVDDIISKYTEYKPVDVKAYNGRTSYNIKVNLPLFKNLGSDGDILNKRIKNIFKDDFYSYDGSVGNRIKCGVYYYKDILSIVFITNPADYHFPMDYAFNINVKTKKIVTNDEMLRKVGSSLNVYRNNADRFLSSVFYEMHGSDESTGKVGKSMQDVYDKYAGYINSTSDAKGYVQRAYRITLDDKTNRNGTSAMFIDNSGKLFVDLVIGSMAGADAYNHFVEYK